MRIAVCVPSHDNVPFLFAYDLAGLMAFTGSVMPEDTQLGILGVTGTYVHKARQELADAALAQRADYILWIDSDMRFPREALVGLLQRKLPVVGINYVTRSVPAEFVAIKKTGQAGGRGQKLPTTEKSTGTEEVEALGFGMVLMETKALAKMPDPAVTPWFQNKYLGDGKWMGEDVHFCELYRQSGGRIFVDHDLSQACAHIGQWEYRTAHAAVKG